MGRRLREVIAALEEGGEAARESLADADELLRTAWRQGFEPVDHSRGEQITDEEAIRLRAALADYYEREACSSSRRAALRALAEEGDASSREQLARELHTLLEAHRCLSADLLQLLLALEGLGDEVYPDSLTRRSISDVQNNVEAAARYLARRGIVVPL